MTQPMLFTFIILVCTFGLIIQRKFRADLIALASLLILGLTGVVTTEEALSGFSSPIVLMLASLYIVGAGIFNSGLAVKVGNRLLLWGKGSEVKIIVIVMITAGILSAFLSGTAIVALLLPMVTSMALQNKRNPSRFLLPLAYASCLGGMLTLIGTSPNLIVSEVLRQNGYASLNFFDFTPIGLITLAAGLLFMLLIGRKLLPHRSGSSHNTIKGLTAGELAGMYKVYDRLYYLHIPGHSDIVGERLSDLSLPVNYEITVIEIKRKLKEKQIVILPKTQTLSARAEEILHPEDIILVFGEKEAVTKLSLDYELELKPFTQEEIRKHFVSSEFGLTEMLIMPHSDFENQSLRDVQFREKYQCSVLAINRKGEYIQTDLGFEYLTPGDALLIHGEWENIERLSADLQDVVVIGSASEESEQIYSEKKAPIAAGVTILMTVLLCFDFFSPVLTVMVAALLMIITGCVRSIEEAYQRINWEPVIIIGAMLPMATALENTGGAMLISSWLDDILGGFGPYGLLAGIYLLTMLSSQLISNGATAVLIAPIAYTAAENLQFSPVPFLICVAVAASMAFSTPASSPTNTLVMTAGEYSFKDFALIGILLQIFIGIIMIFTVPIFFPF